MEKPILIIGSSDVVIPLPAGHQVLLRTDSVSTEVTRLAIQQFVADMRSKKRPTRQRKFIEPSVNFQRIKSIRDNIRELRKSCTEMDLANAVLELLEASGVSAVSNQMGAVEKGADLALWSDHLQLTLGNPILVEIRGGAFRGKLVKDAERNLIDALGKAQAQTGILLYLNRDGDRVEAPQTGYPFIYCADIEDFASELLERPFHSILLQWRNRAVHGIMP